jgi:flagellar protein FlaJ
MKFDIKRIPLIVAVILIAIGLLFYNNLGLMGNFIFLGIVIGVAPYAFLSYMEYSKIKSIEDQLPTFLLDLAESQKVGMTLPEALKQASRIDYGKLTPEVKKMSNQLSWGIPLQQVLDNFSKRMEKSKLIKRVVRVINDAYFSGGNLARTMEAIASDITAIKEAEKERKSVTHQHMLIMYAIYFIFIGIVISLSKTLIPLLSMNVEGGAALGNILSFQDPCVICANNPQIFCISCSIFSIFCKMFELGEGGGCYYNALFILMVIIQGIFSGLVAGQIGEGSAIAGIKHSIIMTLSGFGILILVLKFGLI